MFLQSGSFLNINHPVNDHDPLNRGLLAWYMALPGFNFSGYTWKDLKRFADGSMNGFSQGASSGWSASERGRGGFGRVNFDGVDDYVDLGDHFGGQAAITYTCWLKIYAAPDVSGLLPFNIMGKVDDNTSFAGVSWQLYYDGTITAVLGGPDKVLTVGSVGINTLTFIAVTYDGANATIYRDGYPVATTAASGALNAKTGISSKFGTSDAPSFNGFYNGSIDDVRIYDRALSDAEIFALLNASETGYQFQLNYVSATALGGASGVASRGKLVGLPWASHASIGGGLAG